MKKAKQAKPIVGKKLNNNSVLWHHDAIYYKKMEKIFGKASDDSVFDVLMDFCRCPENTSCPDKLVEIMRKWPDESAAYIVWARKKIKSESPIRRYIFECIRRGSVNTGTRVVPWDNVTFSDILLGIQHNRPECKSASYYVVQAECYRIDKLVKKRSLEFHKEVLELEEEVKRRRAELAATLSLKAQLFKVAAEILRPREKGE